MISTEYATEREVGTALSESEVPRGNRFLTAKTLNLNDVEGALEQSLANLKTPYVDL
jgi:diketogulonate reductase-like aldo/keto reductase